MTKDDIKDKTFAEALDDLLAEYTEVDLDDIIAAMELALEGLADEQESKTKDDED
jgi:hypothetical protein